jgi:pimeloyl-ACP methyl ester carboxylesterase
MGANAIEHRDGSIHAGHAKGTTLDSELANLTLRGQLGRRANSHKLVHNGHSLRAAADIQVNRPAQLTYMETMLLAKGEGRKIPIMTRKKIRPRPTTHPRASAYDWALDSGRPPSASPPTVSGRWLLAATGLTMVAAAVCAWGTLCLLFWQGSWQLLYHPVAAVTRTPASTGLAYEAVGFATAESGQPRLKGWWVPAAHEGKFSRYTVLYLHGQDENMGDAVEAVAGLHAVGVNVLAFDYRGYGQSQFARPSEAHWSEDAEWALEYLTGTRRVAAGTIILEGRDLGANLALEIAAAHPELAGVIVRNPLPEPMDPIFVDQRAKMVPAHWLVKDRFDADAPASALRIPSLWLLQIASPPNIGMVKELSVFKRVSARKKLLWLPEGSIAPGEESDALSGLLGIPPASTHN